MSKPWYCDVFERQRIAIGYSTDELARHANGFLDDDHPIDARAVADIVQGRLVPAVDVFEAVAGALCMDVRLVDVRTEVAAIEQEDEPADGSEQPA